MKKLKGMKLISPALISLLVLINSPVNAEVASITASFKPDPSKPNSREFTNTTPMSGFCSLIPEGACKRWNMFSIGTRIQANSINSISAGHANPRQDAMFSVPAAWKSMSVQNSEGKTFPLEVRISAIAARYRLSHRAQDLTGQENQYDAHSRLWSEGDWGVPAKPCNWGPSPAFITDKEFDFIWTTPVEGVCATQALFDIPAFSYLDISFAYELRTPDPLKMPPGIYTGTQTYTVGPGMDFDMGDNMLPTDSLIQLDFTLTVDHVFSIEIPPGGNKVELLPQGGWQAWLNQGRRPTRLFRDQTFNIWTSSPFKMSMECEYSQDGNTCSLREPVSGHVVPLKVSVSLPHGLTDADGQSVSRRQLLRDGSGTELFQPNFYVDRKPGTLHFEIPPDELVEMIGTGPSRTYSGNVTVIWDSQI